MKLDQMEHVVHVVLGRGHQIEGEEGEKDRMGRGIERRNES